MANYKVKILEIENLTHDVKRFVMEKPEGYTFVPGQATEAAINKPEWREEKRPFTFTSRNDDPYLEFIIKKYPVNNGTTAALHKLTAGDELLIDDAWGVMSYKGPGVFIAGGTGITPFLAILRQLQKQNNTKGNKLIYSNKTEGDCILKDELTQLLGPDFINLVTDAERDGKINGRVDRDLLGNSITDFSQYFYVCGPEKFMEAVTGALPDLGADKSKIIVET